MVCRLHLFDQIQISFTADKRTQSIPNLRAVCSHLLSALHYIVVGLHLLCYFRLLQVTWIIESTICNGFDAPKMSQNTGVFSSSTEVEAINYVSAHDNETLRSCSQGRRRSGWWLGQTEYSTRKNCTFLCLTYNLIDSMT